MPHTDITKIISSIQLPDGGVYEIHDAKAIHTIEELGLSAALVFKGTKGSESEVHAITKAKVGDVYLVPSTGAEYVCKEAIDGTAKAASWEKLGNIHDAASSTHTHDVSVTGENASSAVTGKVTVPTVSKDQKYMSATSSAPGVTPQTDSVLGADTQFEVDGTVTTGKLKATAQGVAVGANGTATPITGFGAHTTDSALGTGATFKTSGGAATTKKMETSKASKVTVTDKSIPNVTGNETVTASKVKSAGSKTAGTAASWSANVTNGVLSFAWTANTPTAVTLPTFDSVTATNTTLGDAISASAVSASDVTVATGALTTTGAGADVVTGVSAVSVAVDNADAVSAITELGAPTTATVLTGVKVTSQPTVTLTTGTTGDVTVVTDVSEMTVTASGDNVAALTSVAVAAPSITLTNNASNVAGSVPVVAGVTVGTADAAIEDGVAAAQKWTQKSGSTGAPK